MSHDAMKKGFEALDSFLRRADVGVDRNRRVSNVFIAHSANLSGYFMTHLWKNNNMKHFIHFPPS